MVVRPQTWAGSGCAGALPGLACWLTLLLVAAGCQTVVPAKETDKPEQAAEQPRPAAAQVVKAEANAATVEKAPAAEADPARSHLSEAASCLENGDEEHACPHLARYLAAHPEHLVVRGHYAEVLMRLQRWPEARSEYERCVADAQELGASGLRQQVHCHSRLMQIAEAQEEEYDEHLHRGIGLYLLARLPAGDAGEDGEHPESLLCKAAAELSLAHLERLDQAQPCWYLYQVWTKLAQRGPALRSLRQAEHAAPFSYLTPHEQDGLHLACCRHESLVLQK
jgi:hypothetical protein